MRIFVTPFYNRLQKMKIHIKPTDLNEKVLQNNPLRASQKGDGIGPESIKKWPQNQIVEKETLIAIWINMQ